ncbi:hypothetical protein [Lysinibacillus sp. FSL K6-0102]|uniref:hypothetical protein n=1 Tax=Lysinibacillus sp. FSL K6-0102 TaxID=2975290 RepID=UPI0030F554B3
MKRWLLVVSNKENDKKYLWDPIKGMNVVPYGYRKVTQSIPLDESKYGHLPLLT